MFRSLTTGVLSAALALTTLGLSAEAQSRLPAQLSLPQHDHAQCGLTDLPQSEADAVSEVLAAYRAEHGSTVERFGGFPTIYIPLAYHIVLGTGVEGPSEEAIIAQHDRMNVAFEGTGFRFLLAYVGTVVNDDWYGVVAPGTGGARNNEAALEMKRALSIDPPSTLNVFFTEFSPERSTLLGYGAFPNEWDEEDAEWSIINRIGTLPGGDANNYNGGDTMVHEVGHNINLYHTFQGGCHADSQCEVAGDRVCDTPAQAAQPSTGCPGPNVDTCPTSEGNDPNNNFMNYLIDQCASEFTEGQAERAHASMAAFRPTIYNASLAVGTATRQIDFDETYVGFPETETVYLFNATDEASTVSAVAVPEGFAVDIAAPFSIPAGESVAITVTFDPTAASVYAGTLVFAVDGAPDVEIDLDGFGRLAPDVAVDAVPVVVELQPGTSGQAAFELLNEGPGTLDWTADGFAARQSARGPGGPDAFGYTWADSRDDYGPAFAFDDIVGTSGTLTLGLGNDDAATVPLPFAFPFYGDSYTQAAIVSNGRVHFGDDVSTRGSNTPIPSTSEPNGFVAPFWEALDVSTGAVYYKPFPAEGRAVVQWDEVARAADPEARLTFQAVLYADGRVLFQYETLAGAAAREVIGVENQIGTVGLQIAARTAFAEEGLAVLVAPPFAFLAGVTPSGGTVAPQSTQAIAVSVAAPAGLLPGTYVERVFVRSNDPDERVVGVPVVLQVNPAGAPGIPQPVSPAYGATIDGAPAVAWTSTGAAAYDVEVAADERFAEVVYRAEDVTATAAELSSGLAPGGTYYWHVRSDAGGGSVSTWSAPYVFTTVLGSSAEEAAGPGGAAATRLVGAYPNPARTSATVRFALSEAGAASVVVYDVLGQEVARLAAGQYGAGEHEAELQAGVLAPGVYLVRLVAGAVVETQQILVAR